MEFLIGGCLLLFFFGLFLSHLITTLNTFFNSAGLTSSNSRSGSFSLKLTQLVQWKAKPQQVWFNVCLSCPPFVCLFEKRLNLLYYWNSWWKWVLGRKSVLGVKIMRLPYYPLISPESLLRISEKKGCPGKISLRHFCQPEISLVWTKNQVHNEYYIGFSRSQLSFSCQENSVTGE